MEKMLRFVTLRYNKRNCLGTRKIVAEEDEIQPNGRVFKKVIRNFQVILTPSRGFFLLLLLNSKFFD